MLLMDALPDCVPLTMGRSKEPLRRSGSGSVSTPRSTEGHFLANGRRIYSIWPSFLEMSGRFVGGMIWVAAGSKKRFSSSLAWRSSPHPSYHFHSNLADTEI
jgi:hypothetical protein